jgi:choline dehydrogenase
MRMASATGDNPFNPHPLKRMTMNNHSNDTNAPSDSLLEHLERALIAGRLNRRGFMRAATAAGFSTMGLSALADELDAIRANQNERSAKLQAAYDYVVVGTGSAACALVGRLATRKDASILMIEAGDWDTAPSVMDPSVWFTNLGSDRDWKDVALASPSTNNRAIPEHMGRVVGGGSSINATIWARPFKADLEFWAEASGDRAWGYESGLEIYRRMENWQGAPDARYRGKNGPVWCQPAHNPHPAAPAMLEACRTLGYPVFADQNGVREEGGIGFALMNQIIRDGRRQSMARSYLYPILSRPNVTVMVNTHVDRLTFAGTKVTGVQIATAAGPKIISANTEVIVSAGGINTPKLLMLSGIGECQRSRPQLPGPHPAWRLHLGAQGAHSPSQQRGQCSGLSQESGRAGIARRQPGADRTALRQRCGRQGIRAPRHQLGAVRWFGRTQEPWRDSSELGQPCRSSCGRCPLHEPSR